MRRPSGREPINQADAILMRVFKETGITTDKELAQRLGIPASTVSGWRNRGNVPGDHLRDISDKFGIPIGTLMGETILNPQELVTRSIGEVARMGGMVEVIRNAANEAQENLDALYRSLTTLNRHLAEFKANPTEQKIL